MTAETSALPKAFARYWDRIDAALKSAVDGPSHSLYTMARYQLGWVDERDAPVETDRGKAVRPTLCLLMCESLGGDVEAAVPAAAGLELLHNFSLIHDDVMDRDETRRHRPTVWRIWGQSQAINAGDLMNVLAMLSVLGAGDARGDPVRARDAAEVLARGCGRMTQGQYLDIEFESQVEVSVDEYLEMVAGKTAALIGAAFEIGAIFADNDPTTRTRCGDYGRMLGTAFQIRDDLLGTWGDPAVTGKPADSDIRQRKKTLPIVHAMQSGSREDRRRLRAMFAQTGSDADVDLTMEILSRAGSREFAEAEANRCLAEAATLLDRLPVSDEGRDELADAAAFLIGRRK